MADEIRPLDTPEAEERREAGERKLFIRLPGLDDPRTRKVKLALSLFPRGSSRWCCITRISGSSPRDTV